MVLPLYISSTDHASEQILMRLMLTHLVSRAEPTARDLSGASVEEHHPHPPLWECGYQEVPVIL